MTAMKIKSIIGFVFKLRIWERGCVQSTSRSTLTRFAVSGEFQQAGFAWLLRLVFDTAALRSICPLNQIVLVHVRTMTQHWGNG